MGCVEVFMNLKKERYFKNILLFFDENDLSLEIKFNSNDKKLNKKILRYYGFYDDFEENGENFDIFFNGKFIKNSNFDTDCLKNKDKIKINYKDEKSFNMYYHCLVYEIDDDHDDMFFLRKELEKWTI
jgi:hypothetical protein